jgi:hypothetical protein
MIDSYWDLYVAYVNKCVRDNWINDIDPHHYRMEWNHFLPKCVFDDWPIGHYLTLKQHAIASALQTLALQKNCMCGWHKKYLPEHLLNLAWPYYCDSSKQTFSKVLSEKDERGKCVMAVRAGKASITRLREQTDDSGKDLLTVRMEKMREAAHREKDELGRSLLGLKNAERMHSEKDEDGKSKLAKRCAQKMNKVKHAQRDEYGRSIAGKDSNLAMQARTIKVTKLDTGETFEFANSVDAGLALGLIPRCLRKVASGERNSVYGYAAEFTS